MDVSQFVDQLDFAEDRYSELGQLISDPDVIDNQERWRRLVKEHARLKELVETLREHRQVTEDLEEAALLLEGGDGGEDDWLRQERQELEARRDQLAEDIKEQLLPPDPRDEKNVIMEIRAGTGGDEAALFAADLVRMYTRFGERQGWDHEALEASPTELGGYKAITIQISGSSVFSRLKYESGVHRVQRVPSTESGGRIHTSTATVAVLPEVEEVEISIDPNDLEIDTFQASGPGGQHVNKTESAVRITHEPSGIVVSCQDEKSQHKNRARAMKVLRARLYDKKMQEQQEKQAAERRSQVGTGDRSERIRTYNFPENRVTDHRINLTLHRLENILDGEIQELIEAVATAVQAERLQELAESQDTAFTALGG